LNSRTALILQTASSTLGLEDLILCSDVRPDAPVETEDLVVHVNHVQVQVRAGPKLATHGRRASARRAKHEHRRLAADGCRVDAAGDAVAVAGPAEGRVGRRRRGRPERRPPAPRRRSRRDDGDRDAVVLSRCSVEIVGVQKGCSCGPLWLGGRRYRGDSPRPDVAACQLRLVSVRTRSLTTWPCFSARASRAAGSSSTAGALPISRDRSPENQTAS
jgi:hypothetical protein